MLFVIPTENGHFNNYISLFKNKDDFEGSYVLDKTSIKIVFRFLLFLIKNNKRNIVFFHGEKHYLVSVLTSFIIKRILGGKVSSIFYYAYATSDSVIKNIFYSTSLLMMKVAGLRTFYLELPFNNINTSYHRFFTVLHDPVLIDFDYNAQLKKEQKQEQEIKERKVSLLAAGFLDTRKCIGEIISAANLMLEHDYFEKVELTLLGCQSPDVEKIIKKSKIHPNLCIIQKNYRFDDSELISEMKNTDIVLAIYEQHFGSSGIVINSVALNKKVAFISYGVCKNFQNDLGIAKNLENTNAMTICQFVNDLAHATELQYSEKNRISFLEKRDPKVFIEKLSM
ncbi:MULTISPECIES: hypothetical protein [Shewanella]|uniref:hypothetical protein n=1 Tax=Shewanella TaxID=22 RepID=UPI001AB00D61|nr:hypothetical protein [Shewanella algae]MBO2661849.1 hypothetical protein [Shewanella algae]MCL1053029.1 hypothetical protein [Shewanella algae]